MQDSVIEEFTRKVLDWRQFPGHGIHTHDLRRWAEHLRNVVQPQLDELEQLKAQMASGKNAKKSTVPA